MTGTVKVRVLEGWAVYDGETQRGAGEQLDVPADLAGRWSIAGWVEPVKPPRRTKK